MASKELDESSLLEALRSGDEEVFAEVVDRYSGSLLRMAMAYVPSRAVAEEVVQETWLGVFEGVCHVLKGVPHLKHGFLKY